MAQTIGAKQTNKNFDSNGFPIYGANVVGNAVSGLTIPTNAEQPIMQNGMANGNPVDASLSGMPQFGTNVVQDAIAAAPTGANKSTLNGDWLSPSETAHMWFGGISGLATGLGNYFTAQMNNNAAMDKQHDSQAYNDKILAEERARRGSVGKESSGKSGILGSKVSIKRG